jgi:hypothetical protein
MSTLTTGAAAAAFAAVLLVPVLARAQEQGPDPEEMKQKILEIERLMKSAEQSLARSTDTRSAADRAAEAAKKMLDEKARKETGKSAEELRKLAEGGSKEAAETLERLTKAANEESKKAAEKLTEVLGGGSGSPGSAGEGSSGSGQGIKKLIEKIKGDGQGASEGIKWILAKTKTSPSQSQGGGGGGSGSPDKQKQPDAPDPKKPDEKKPEDKKPQSNTEPPRTPPFEQWYAELPEQVRKAYDSQDWDSIPPKWREMLKEWTKKMADEFETKKERR